MNRFFVADRKRARFYRRRWLPHGRLRLEVVAELEDDEEERERRGGKRDTIWGHEDETNLRRWAKRLAIWIEHQSGRHDVWEPVLLAPDRLCGALREQWPPGSRVREKHCDVAHLGPADLARHRTIRSLLSESEPS